MGVINDDIFCPGQELPGAGGKVPCGDVGVFGDAGNIGSGHPAGDLDEYPVQPGVAALVAYGFDCDVGFCERVGHFPAGDSTTMQQADEFGISQ